ncbi:MAG: MT-A70 family methyltransferase [Microgenomates group bacterium]
MHILDLKDKKYDIIYADPAWEYKESGGGVRGTAGLKTTYDGTMSTDDICKIPVKGISSENAILFLWATFPKLEEAMRVTKEWGFVYYGLGFNWIKKNKKTDSLFWGMGYYTRQNPEVCLIGVKKNKKTRIKPISRGVHSVIMSSIREHSRKPSEVREGIVKICGDLPRIELFSREIVEGWDSWGNQVEKY